MLNRFDIRFPDLQSLEDFCAELNKTILLVDKENLTISGDFEEREVELAINGYNAAVGQVIYT